MLNKLVAEEHCFHTLFMFLSTLLISHTNIWAGNWLWHMLITEQLQHIIIFLWWQAQMDVINHLPQ